MVFKLKTSKSVKRSMAEPAFYEIPPIVIGDTWNGISNISIAPSGSYFDFPASFARMQFRKEKRRGGEPLCELNSSGSGILITNDNVTGWQFTIEKANLNLLPGLNYWDLQITDTGGYKYTYLQGFVSGSQDVTR